MCCLVENYCFIYTMYKRQKYCELFHFSLYLEICIYFFRSLLYTLKKKKQKSKKIGLLRSDGEPTPKLSINKINKL